MHFRPFSSNFMIFLKCAVTRIRTWVIAATTQCTNHYTITAVHIFDIEFQVNLHLKFKSFLSAFRCSCNAQSKFDGFSSKQQQETRFRTKMDKNEGCCQGRTCAHVENRFCHTDINVQWKSLFSVGDIAQWQSIRLQIERSLVQTRVSPKLFPKLRNQRF